MNVIRVFVAVIMITFPLLYMFALFVKDKEPKITEGECFIASFILSILTASAASGICMLFNL